MPQLDYDKLGDICDRSFDKLKSGGKDVHDKWGIYLPVAATFLIAIVGFVFTGLYNSSQTAIAKVTLLKEYQPDIKKGGKDGKAAIRALATLGYEDIAREMAVIYGGEEAAAAMCELGADNEDETARGAYFDAWSRIIEARPFLSLVGPPDSTIQEEFTVWAPVPVEVTKDYTVSKVVPRTEARAIPFNP